MKLFLVTLLVVAVAADKLQNVYLPPNSAKTAGGNGNFLATPFQGAASSNRYRTASVGNRFNAFGSSAQASNFGGFGGRSAGKGVAILRLNNQNNGDGSYQFDFETENGITQQESGQVKNAGSQQESSIVQGSYSYTAPDGQVITVTYTADENGFQPQGAHLPTPPPIPPEILKSIQQNAAEEAAGKSNDGQYNAQASNQFAVRGGPYPSSRFSNFGQQQRGGYRY